MCGRVPVVYMERDKYMNMPVHVKPMRKCLSVCMCLCVFVYEFVMSACVCWAGGVGWGVHVNQFAHLCV